MQTRSLQLNMQLDGVLKRKPEKIQAAGIQTLTCAILVPVSYTHLTLPTKRIV